jgi:hypothetical protein
MPEIQVMWEAAALCMLTGLVAIPVVLFAAGAVLYAVGWLIGRFR